MHKHHNKTQELWNWILSEEAFEFPYFVSKLKYVNLGGWSWQFIVGCMISEEDLASGPGTSLHYSRAFVRQSFIKVIKGTEKVSGIDIRRGTESDPLVLSSPYILLPDPLPQHTSYDNKINQKVLTKKEKHTLEQVTLLLYNHYYRA